jgi:hypothetical protein
LAATRAVATYIYGANTSVVYLISDCEQGILLGVSIYLFCSMPVEDRPLAGEDEQEEAGDRLERAGRTESFAIR